MTIRTDGCQFYNTNQLWDNKGPIFDQEVTNYEANHCVHLVLSSVSVWISTCQAKPVLNITLYVCRVCFIPIVINSCCRTRAEYALNAQYFMSKAGRLVKVSLFSLFSPYLQIKPT